MKSNLLKEKKVAVLDEDDAPEMDDAFVERLFNHIDKAPKKSITVGLDPLVYKYFHSFRDGNIEQRICNVLRDYVIDNL